MAAAAVPMAAGKKPPGPNAPNPRRFTVPSGAAPGEAQYDKNEVTGAARNFDDAVSYLVLKLGAPMTWNYWQSFMSHLCKYYGQPFDGPKMRVLYNKVNVEKFGAEWEKMLPKRAYTTRQKPESMGQPTGGRSGPTSQAQRGTPAAKSGAAVARACIVVQP